MLLKYLEANKHRAVTTSELYTQMNGYSQEEQRAELDDLKEQPNVGHWWDSKEQKAYWRFYPMSKLEIIKRKAMLRNW